MAFRITSDTQLATLRKKGLTKEKLDNQYEIKMFNIFAAEFGDLTKGGEVAREVFGMIQGRDYRVDVALPRYKIGIELDGYANHGAYIKGFKRDRDKDLLLMLNGWQVLRLYPKQINDPYAIRAVKRAVLARDREEITFKVTDAGWIKLL